MQQWVRLINETMNVNSRMVLKSRHLLPKKSANEKLGVAIELWPGSLWRIFPFVEWGGLVCSLHQVLQSSRLFCRTWACIDWLL